MPSLTVLMGHRGAGKTSLLRRIPSYQPEAECRCLDEEIEKRHGPIKDIFIAYNEEYFRGLEVEVFQELLKNRDPYRPCFIAVGGGFRGAIPREAKKIWVRRDLDISQAFYSDRPSLSQDVENLKTPQDLFESRELRFMTLADEEITLREGAFQPNRPEYLYFTQKISEVGGALTLRPQDIESPHAAEWFKERMRWGVHAFELRTDLLEKEHILKALSLIPPEKILFSFRHEEVTPETLSWAMSAGQVDWPMEWPSAPPHELSDKTTLSLHSAPEQFQEHLAELREIRKPVKWSPWIETLSELKLGHQWYLESPKQRSFLPRSATGKWRWYRLRMKALHPIQFFREGVGSAADQPTLFQWLATHGNFQYFAAVLGEPVDHSWSPAFHGEFFETKELNFFAIPLARDEWNEDNLKFLWDLGLRAAAVTSPFKERAAELSREPFPVNTLAWSEKEKKWKGTSTDGDGLLYSLKIHGLLNTEGGDTVVWGGGGMLPSLRAVFPGASFYSASSATPRDFSKPCENPQRLVWAAGDRSAPILSQWKPQVVLDLSYRKDSPAISWAHQWGAKYFSGDELFYGQAREQQKYWKSWSWD